MPRLKTRWKVAAAVPLVLIGASVLVIAINAPPDVPIISTAEAAATTKPFVVKAHARWCRVCVTTMGVWEEVERAYTGRVNLVVFDLTTEATFEAARVEARRIGLETFFNENVYGSGSVFVVDGRTKQVRNDIYGSRDFAEYRTAIDEALRDATP